MQLLILIPVVLSFCPRFTFVLCSTLEKRQDCGSGFNQCSPAGASSTTVPDFASGLSSLYVNLLHSVAGISAVRRDAVPEIKDMVRRSSPNICCAMGTDCLLLQGYNIPFCYDKFTTNFFLPDDSYGTIDDGDYSTSGVSHANLLTGQYTFTNGTSGNIYGSANSPEVPNTSTLTLPSPYTSAGVGSAIPASDLGAFATFTITVPASTISASTLPAEVVSPVVLGSTTIPTATTDSATTIPGTTIPPTTYTVTSHIAGATTVAGAAAVTTSAGGAAGLTYGPRAMVGAGALIFVLVFFSGTW